MNPMHLLTQSFTILHLRLHLNRRLPAFLGESQSLLAEKAALAQKLRDIALGAGSIFFNNEQINSALDQNQLLFFWSSAEPREMLFALEAAQTMLKVTAQKDCSYQISLAIHCQHEEGDAQNIRKTLIYAKKINEVAHGNGIALGVSQEAQEILKSMIPLQKIPHGLRLESQTQDPLYEPIARPAFDPCAPILARSQTKAVNQIQKSTEKKPSIRPSSRLSWQGGLD